MISNKRGSKVRPFAIALAGVLVLAAVAAAYTFGAREAYAVSGTLDEDTCTEAGASWDEGTCTVDGTLEVGRAEALTIPSGTTLAVGPDGKIITFFSEIAVEDGGTIDNAGTVDINYNILFNNGTIDNSGTLNNLSFGTIRNNPTGVINNEAGGTLNNRENIIHNDGTINNRGAMTNIGHIENSGTITDYCGTFTGTMPTSGNAIVDRCEAGQFGLTVESVDLSGDPVKGIWTVVRGADGAVAGSGYTPLVFAGDAGADYVVSVSDYDGKAFENWKDGGTNGTRTVNLTANTTLTARYDTGDALRGFAPLTYTGTQEQPDLAVDTKTLDGEALHMYVIIDPQPKEESSTAESSDGEPTITISSDTDYDSLVVQEDDVLLIESGAVVDAETLANHGKIINHGTLRLNPFAGFDCGDCPPGTFPLPMVNEGTIINYGFLAPPGHGTTYNNGTIVIKEGGTMSLARVSSAAPGKLVNGEDAVIDNFGLVTAPLYGDHRVSVENNGTMYLQCTGTYNLPSTVPGPGLGIFTGNTIVDACDAAMTYRLYAGEYQGKLFDHWSDGSTDRVRDITVSEEAALTAYYRTG